MFVGERVQSLLWLAHVSVVKCCLEQWCVQAVVSLHTPKWTFAHGAFPPPVLHLALLCSPTSGVFAFGA